jgi:hypothetical protein
MYSEFNEFIWKDACIYTVLLKAMYGFVQASAPWYALIWSVIEEMGYTGGETDKCVFVKQVGDCLYILLLYFYDIFFCDGRRGSGEVKNEIGRVVRYHPI